MAESQDWRKAETAYTTALRHCDLYPASTRAMVRTERAKVLFRQPKQPKIEVALSDIDQAIATNYNPSTCHDSVRWSLQREEQWALKGQILLAWKPSRYDEAITAFQEAMKCKSTDAIQTLLEGAQKAKAEHDSKAINAKPRTCKKRTVPVRGFQSSSSSSGGGGGGREFHEDAGEIPPVSEDFLAKRHGDMKRRIEKKRARIRAIQGQGLETSSEQVLTEKEAINGVTEESINAWLEQDPIDQAGLRELWVAQQGVCALTGREMTTEANAPNVGSVDRKDSTRGYTPDNVQWVCAWVNYMKGPVDEELFFDRCAELAAWAPQWRKQKMAEMRSEVRWLKERLKEAEEQNSGASLQHTMPDEAGQVQVAPSADEAEEKLTNEKKRKLDDVVAGPGE